jgi:hypothetical protein
MAYTTIDKPDEYFNTKLYTGNAGTQSITGVGFAPDWVWFKARNNTDTHAVFDIVRGVQQRLIPNNNSAEGTQSNGLTSFDSDGFTVGDAGIVNQGYNYVAWNWKANGAGVSNTAGSISSTVSANTTSGFSIVSYTGTGSLATVGHGLGVTPKMIIVKTRGSGGDWSVYHSSLGNTKNLKLNTTAAEQTSINYWNNTSPTSSVFTVNDEGNVNGSSVGMSAICFAEKKGFSKFGSYTGNGSANGTFVYTGFKPAFILYKNSTAGGDSWQMFDNKRLGYNVKNRQLQPNSSGAEQTSDNIDILSNGFKQRQTASGGNQSSATYIYMAFAENPFVTSTSIPTTAR